MSLPLWSGSSQTYPSLARCFLILLLVTVTSADTDTHSYNSNLELGGGYLTVTHAKPLDSNTNVEIAIPSLFKTKKKKSG